MNVAEEVVAFNRRKGHPSIQRLNRIPLVLYRRPEGLLHADDLDNQANALVELRDTELASAPAPPLPSARSASGDGKNEFVL